MERRSTSADPPDWRGRDAMETIPAESDALAQLRRQTRLDEEVEALLSAAPVAAGTKPHPRAPLASIPFDLQPRVPLALEARRPLASIPFELSRGVALPIDACGTAAPDGEIELPSPKPRRGRWIWVMALLLAVVCGFFAAETIQRILVFQAR